MTSYLIRPLRFADAPAILDAFRRDALLSREACVRSVSEAELFVLRYSQPRQAYSEILLRQEEGDGKREKEMFLGTSATADKAAAPRFRSPGEPTLHPAASPSPGLPRSAPLPTSQDDRAYFVPEKSTLLSFAAAEFNLRHQTAWLSYWTVADERNKGYASLLVRSFVRRVFDAFPVARIELEYRVDNPASAEVAARAAFQIEGVQRRKFATASGRVDVVLASRLRDDPAPAEPFIRGLHLGLGTVRRPRREEEHPAASAPLLL